MIEPAGREAAGSVDLSPSGDGTLLFMHIPKTAGTLLRDAVSKVYVPDERVFVYDPQHVRGAVSAGEFASLPEARRRRLRLVMGHFRYGLDAAIPSPFAYVTMLRDPIDRVVSLYSHHRRSWSFVHKLLRPGLRDGSPAARERNLIRTSGMSLEEWVFERHPLPADNAFVRLICGRQDVPFGSVSDSMLSEAMDHVDAHFAALLVNEEMERSLAILGAMTGRPLRLARRRNVNRQRIALDALTPQLRDRLAELNCFDMALYRLARERLPGLVERYTG